MADFDQLALKFVLEDDHPTRDALAAEAAEVIKSTPRASNPIRKWVESVRPWILGDDGEAGSGDRIARARALDFLSTTLHLLDKDFLRLDQIKVLIAYFSSMFTIDHRSGILPSAKALSTLTSMEFFPVDAAPSMLHSVCAMGDEFRNQIPVTRLAVYELFTTCVTNPAIASELRSKQSPDLVFIKEMIAMCGSERDPKNILKWFGLLAIFLREFHPSTELSLEIFNTFSAYFPISLRASQHPSGITADDLKLALRDCFVANPLMAPHAFPFLLSKIEQGTGVTANVKASLDIIRTLEAGIKTYDPCKTTVVPFADRIWSALKYEVRNGDVDDTIDATLDLFTTLAKRLEGDDLQTFALSVLRECTDDLSSSTYSAGAGKLLVALMRAKFPAFAPLAAPVVNHIRDALRHSKSPEHASALLTLLNSVLAIRLLYLQKPEGLSDEEQLAFRAVDPTFVTLYESTLKKMFAERSAINRNAVQSLGLLASQPCAVEKGTLLLAHSTCQDITAELTNMIVQPSDITPSVLQDAVEALQRIVSTLPEAFDQILKSSLTAGKSSDDIDAFVILMSQVAFIGCSELPKAGSTHSNFLLLTTSLLNALDGDIVKAQESAGFSHLTWSVYLTGLQAALMNFSDIYYAKWPLAPSLGFPDGATKDSWVSYIHKRFPSLPAYEGTSTKNDAPVDATDEPSDIANTDILLIGLYAVRGIFQRVLSVSDFQVNLAAPFNDGSDSSRRFIFFLGQLSTYVISQLTEKQQQLLSLQEEVFALFHSDVIKKVIDTVHPAEYFEEKSPDTLLSSPSIVPSCLDLSTSCLQALRPSVVSGLFSSGFGQEVIAQCLLSHDATEPTVARAYWLTVLANKHAFEKSPKLLALLESRLAVLVTSSDDVLVTANAVYGLLAGALRRYTGSSLSASLDLLRKLTSNPTLGHIFAQWYDYLFSPKPRLAKAFHGLTKPTWTQRAYIELLVPLLQAALPCPTSNPTEKLAAANATVAVLAAVRHLSFTVYQDDAPVLVRTVLAALSTLPSSLVAAPALAILEAVMASSPTLLESHARSAIDVCLRISVLDTSTANIAASADNSWMPSGFGEISNPGPVLAAARKSALALLGQMPERFEHRHLVELAPRVKRALAVASGDKVRAVRGIATKARMAWNTVDA
ncbi:DNA repair/transcription protein mms19 [Ceratocystis lukuohia]|uniref:MMS19 nucleotide excision repair protein n=1 Tax=Ceratocystis lukuohia TaxID=2019550 RepID=A0ABR4MI74_9PEZI